MGLAVLVFGVVAFVGIHSVALVGLRDRAVERLGEGPWKGLYSLVAIVGMVAMVLGYSWARTSPTLIWQPTMPFRHTALAVMLPVFPLMWAAYLPGRIQSAVGHPMLVGTALWSGAHLLANGTLADLVLFGGLVLWAVANRASFTWRTAREIPMAPKRGLNDGVAVVGGLITYAAFLGGLHAWLFGVSPL